MTNNVERAVGSNSVAERVRRTAERTKRAGAAAVVGALLLLAAFAADTLLPDALVRETGSLGYSLVGGGLFVGSALLLASLPAAYRRGSSRFGSVGLALSGAGFALAAAGSGAQVALAAVGRTDAAELVGFVFAAGLLVGVAATLPLGVAFLFGSGGTVARVCGVLLLASMPGLVASLAVSEASAPLAVLAFSAYPLAWAAVGYSLRTDTSGPVEAEFLR